MDDATRLMHLLSYLKINAAEFSRKTNINQASVSAIAGGKRRITIEMLHKIIQAFPVVNIDWLLKGIGNPLNDLPDRAPFILQENIGEYQTTESPPFAPAFPMPDDDAVRSTIAENLRVVGRRWELTQIELLQLLGMQLGRQGASRYFKRTTMLKHSQLLNLSRLTGWPLNILCLRVIVIDELPDRPLLTAPLIQEQISTAEVELIRNELTQIGKRIAKLLSKIEQKGEDK